MFSVPLDRPQETSVSLTLPKSFVTVLGEPKNILANLSIILVCEMLSLSSF